MSLFDAIPTPWRAGIAVVTVIGLSAFYLQHRAAIYRDGWDDAMIKIEQELDLQEAANREAMRLAGKQYAQTIDAITLERDRLNEALTTLDLEAAADRGAAQCGIGAGSVQRLNSVR